MKNGFKFEKQARRNGFKIIAGVDEVGRAPLAGPVTSAAIILPVGCSIKADDSKKLTIAEREELFPQLLKECIDYGVGMVSPAVIDRINIHNASLLSMKIAIENLAIKPDIIFVDGRFLIPGLKIWQKAIIGGDRKSKSVAAASIIAKVVRDRLMTQYHEDYPNYGFDTNKGYWSRKHFEGIIEYGLSPIHRKRFRITRKDFSFPPKRLLCATSSNSEY